MTGEESEYHQEGNREPEEGEKYRKDFEYSESGNIPTRNQKGTRNKRESYPENAGNEDVKPVSKA